MFGNILKMLFSYKFFTLSQPFSQLPNKFYITKPTTTQHKNHQNATTHTATQKKKKKSEIKEIKQIGERVDPRESDWRESKLAREWSTIKQIGDDQTRFKREKEIEKERDRRCELRTWCRELDGAILPLHLGLGHCSLSLLSLLSLSLSTVPLRLWVLLSLSLSLFACLWVPLFAHLWVLEVIWM